MSNATYTVTGDAGDLAGWTPYTLTNALQGPLNEIGVNVECKPHQSGGGGLSGDVDDELRERVQAIVEQVVSA